MPDTERDSSFRRLRPAEARALRLRLQRLVRDATQLNLPDEARLASREPFWELEPTPLVVPADEWQRISTAVIQRARLINALLQDVYSGQEILQAQLLPPEIIFADPQYRRACLNLEPGRKSPATLLRFDLEKGASGWVFTGVQVNCPVGAGYAVQNRRFLTQEAAHLYSTLPDYCSVVKFPLELLDALRQLSPRGPGDASIVVLTAGPQDPFYTEHSFLARKMGVPLARGDDLLVLDNRVYFKSIAGLEPVDVIFRRVDDAHIDPVVFATPRQSEGVPGLIQCVRKGTVVMANSIGAGLAQSRALDAFSRTLCRFYLGEELLIPSVPTFLLQEDDAVESLIGRYGALRLRLTHALPPAAMLRRAPADILIRRGERVPAYARAAPHDYVLQALHAFEQAAPGGKRAGATTLSAFVLAQGTQYRVLPGGLAHASGEAPQINRVGIVSDVVVLIGAENAEPGSSFAAGAGTLRTPLGSRTAEHLYWLGRYLERAEATARMLSIFGDVAMEEIPSRERQKWLPVWRGLLEATGHSAPKLERGTAPRAILSAELTWHMSLDPQHPSSIYSSIDMAFENARQLRDCISPEVWAVLSQLRDKLRDLEDSARSQGGSEGAREEIARDGVQQVLLGVNALLGTAERTLLQDASWHFLRIGLHLERATMTCSALRHILTALEREAVAKPGVLGFDNPELSALVRMLGSQDAYRRLFQAPSIPPLVAELFLKQTAAPRSIRHNVQHIANSLDSLQEEIASGGDLTTGSVRASVQELLAYIAGLDFPAASQAAVGGHFAVRLSGLLELLELLHTQLSDHYFSHQALFPVSNAPEEQALKSESDGN